MRIWLILGGIGALGYYVVSAVKKAAMTFSYKIVGYGKPTVAGVILTIPFIVALHNPSPVAVNVDRVIADLYVFKGGTWVHAARVDQPLQVASGDSRIAINASANLGSIFGGNIIYTITNVAEALSNKLQIKVDVMAVYAGVTLPTQSYTETLQIT